MQVTECSAELSPSLTLPLPCGSLLRELLPQTSAALIDAIHALHPHVSSLPLRTFISPHALQATSTSSTQEAGGGQTETTSGGGGRRDEEHDATHEEGNEEGNEEGVEIAEGSDGDAERSVRFVVQGEVDGGNVPQPPPFPLSPSSPAVVDSFLQDAEMATLVKAVNMRCVEYVFEPGFSQVLVLFY